MIIEFPDIIPDCKTLGNKLWNFLVYLVVASSLDGAFGTQVFVASMTRIMQASYGLRNCQS